MYIYIYIYIYISNWIIGYIFIYNYIFICSSVEMILDRFGQSNKFRKKS